MSAVRAVFALSGQVAAAVAMALRARIAPALVEQLERIEAGVAALGLEADTATA